MRLEIYDSSVAGLLKNRLLKERLIYGTANTLSSLVTPSSVLITQEEKNDLVEDLKLLWHLYNVSNSLYKDSMAGAADPKIMVMAENGLRPEEIQIQREFIRSGLEPKFCRVDYISLGSDRKLAEVQFRPGGPGLFLAIQDVFGEVVPFAPNTESFGKPVQNFRSMITGGREEKVVAVNDTSPSWANGEAYLVKKYAGSCLEYVPVLRDQFADYVSHENGDLFVKADGRMHKVDFFYLFLSPFSKGAPEGDKALYSAIVRNCLDGKVWIEHPPNYTYSAKWQLALPFMKGYANLFTDRLRKILPPTLLLEQKIKMSSIVEYFSNITSGEKNALADITSLNGIAAAGESLRKKVIIKCAASGGHLNFGSKGVYRLSGGKKSIEPVVALISQRLSVGEPWIIQQFINNKHTIPLCLPDNTDQPYIVDAHARFMVFGGRNDDGCYIIGGQGNFGMHWKVTGKAPHVDSNGNLCGTAFNDIRLENDNIKKQSGQIHI